MERGSEENGDAKPLEDVTSDQYTSPVDNQQLINESGSEVSPLQMESEKAKTPCTSDGLKVIIISTISFSISVTVALIVSIYYGPPQVPPHGGVASEVGQCSEVGTKILQDGGSSVDAAIATTFCVGVINAHSSGIGGGGVMVIRDTKKEKTTMLDFLDVAPHLATENMFDSDNSLAKKGALAIAIPGQVAGLEEAHRLYGKLKWKDLVMPAVDIARNGFNVTKEFAQALDSYIQDNGLDDNLDAFLVKGKPVTEGNILKRPDLAYALEEIANQGSEVFYNGALAQNIVDLVLNESGIFSLQDFKEYTVITRNPISSTFSDMTIDTVPAPSSGAIVLSILNIMEAMGIAASNKTDKETYQIFVEAMKFGYAQQGLLGDPGYVPDMESIERDIASKMMAKNLSASVSLDKTHEVRYYLDLVDSYMATSNEGTAHVSVVGPDDFIVSTTSSLNAPFGSSVITSTGIILNNHMADFALPGQDYTDAGVKANPNNYIEKGKRPVSSMTPAIVYAKQHACNIRFAIGGCRGTRIISGVSEVILNVIGLGKNIEEAIQMPRLHNQLDPDEVLYESEFSQKVIDDLEAIGHEVKQSSEALSFVNIVGKQNETVLAYSDSRSGGKASVF